MIFTDTKKDNEKKPKKNRKTSIIQKQIGKAEFKKNKDWKKKGKKLETSKKQEERKKKRKKRKGKGRGKGINTNDSVYNKLRIKSD